MPKQDSSIVLVDICGTLYHSNTTFDFLDFFLKKKSFHMFRRVTKLLVWKLFNKFILAFLGKDLTRSIAIRFLKGYSKEALTAAMDAFFIHRLSKLENKETLRILEEFKKEGKTVILVSATMDFIASRVAQAVNISQYYSTTLNYKNGHCLGTICHDLLRRKSKLLKMNGLNPPYAATITDDFSDLPLLLSSDLAIVVTKKYKANKWEKRLSNHSHYHLIQV